ncbi:unnamed protein product [Adineta steineri]|uniref:Peptidase S54 rhomboid domain-containing protein n=1 Tax=Adineta steineri TaxID=433720 RepID=A0A818K1U9_9BILA|nr:unnamed protein product [Adineta steineri]
MEMSKCLCLMIIAVIVIASNASQFRERRNGGGNSGWSGNNGQNSGSPQTYNVYRTNTYTNTETSNSDTSNKCQSGQNICCNNQADSTTGGRRKRHSSSSNGRSNNGNAVKVIHSQTNQQHTCYNYATNGTTGDQTTGCSTNQSCCQGNTSGGSLASISCSSVSLPSSIGASGAIYGLSLFFIIERLNTMKTNIDHHRFVLMQLILLVVFPMTIITSSGAILDITVGHAAHFGGALVGFLFGIGMFGYPCPCSSNNNYCKEINL